MGWKTNAVLTTLSFLGVGSLVYLIFHKDEELEEGVKVKTSRNTVIEVKIPKESVGIVIGRAGGNIKELQLKSDTKIFFKDEKETDQFRVCCIRGTSEAAQYAESLIHEIIVNQPLIESSEIFVPASACGRIIGKNGENIRLISHNSNAKVSVENVISPTVLERRIIIKGTSEQIMLAKGMIEEKVLEDKNFRNKTDSSSNNRSPRHKMKYLMAGPVDNENVSVQRNEKLTPTSSDGLMEVYVSAVESPSRIWLQLVSPRTVELDRLVDQMTDYYSKEENQELHVLTEVKIGDVIAAPFPYDDKWYRAEVIDLLNDEYDATDTRMKLYYVDYGDSGFVKIKEVYELRTDFLRLRFQAVECILAKVKPVGSTWTEECVELLEELTHVALWRVLMGKINSYRERPTRGKREGSPVPCVELYDSVGDVTIDIAEELIKNGHAVLDEAMVNGRDKT